MATDDEEALPPRAVDVMPVWGRTLAWLSWRAPFGVYVGMLVGALGLLFWGYVGWGAVAGALALSLMLWCTYCRTYHASPWNFVVLQTRQPVPGGLRQAAAEGRPVPPEHPDVVRETRT